MDEALVIVGCLAAGLVGLWVALDRRRHRTRSLTRLFEDFEPGNREDDRRRPRPFTFRRRWLAILLGAACGATLSLGLGWTWTFSGAFGALLALLANQVDALLYQRRFDRIEGQLADAIDLMVASLKVGSGTQQSLQYAAEESRAPLQRELRESIGRIRLGDPAAGVLEDLMDRVPLETFRLFATTLTVNWGTGGSLVGPLSLVGRTIRERIELARRLRALTAQSRASVVVVLMVTYFLAALVWRNDPERMALFLGSTVGQGLVAFALVMQGVGILWIGSLSRVRF